MGRFLQRLGEETLRALVTKAGGERIDFDGVNSPPPTASRAQGAADDPQGAAAPPLPLKPVSLSSAPQQTVLSHVGESSTDKKSYADSGFAVAFERPAQAKSAVAV